MVKKTKAHVKWDKSSDPVVRWEGFYNDLADCAAKKVLSSFSKEFPFYDQLCKAFLKQLNNAKSMALFHARIGEFASTNKHRCEAFVPSSMIGDVEGQIIFTPGTLDEVHVKNGMSIRFAHIVYEWLNGLQWFHQTDDGLTDISWVELFGAFLLCCETFPPVSTRDGDQLLDDNEDVVLYSHTFGQGMKTWRRYVAIIEKQCPLIFPTKIPVSKSICKWNRKGAGLSGRISMTHEIKSTLHQWLSLRNRNLPWPFFEP